MNLVSRSSTSDNNSSALAAAIEAVILIADDDEDFEQVQPVLSIRKESPMPVPLSKSANIMVSAILSFM